MLLLPYRIESLPIERPWANAAFILACVVLSVAALEDALPDPVIGAMIADGWNPAGLFGYVFLHGSYLHLAGNMLFLWVFGNAVCGMVGNTLYLAAFPLCGVLAAVIHNLVVGGSMIGASGAINGVIGFALAICPVNRVTLFYWVVFRLGNVALPAWFIILVWFGFDVYGAANGSGMTAYWAHIGGFVSGLAIGVFVLAREWMVLTEWDSPTLLELLPGRRTEKIGDGQIVAVAVDQPGASDTTGQAESRGTEETLGVGSQLADAPPNRLTTDCTDQTG